MKKKICSWLVMCILLTAVMPLKMIHAQNTMFVQPPVRLEGTSPMSLMLQLTPLMPMSSQFVPEIQILGTAVKPVIKSLSSTQAEIEITQLLPEGTYTIWLNQQNQIFTGQLLITKGKLELLQNAKPATGWTIGTDNRTFQLKLDGASFFTNPPALRILDAVTKQDFSSMLEPVTVISATQIRTGMKELIPAGNYEISLTTAGKTWYTPFSVIAPQWKIINDPLIRQGVKTVINLQSAQITSLTSDRFILRKETNGILSETFLTMISSVSQSVQVELPGTLSSGEYDLIWQRGNVSTVSPVTLPAVISPSGNTIPVVSLSYRDVPDRWKVSQPVTLAVNGTKANGEVTELNENLTFTAVPAHLVNIKGNVLTPLQVGAISLRAVYQGMEVTQSAEILSASDYDKWIQQSAATPEPTQQPQSTTVPAVTPVFSPLVPVSPIPTPVPQLPTGGNTAGSNGGISGGFNGAQIIPTIPLQTASPVTTTAKPSPVPAETPATVNANKSPSPTSTPPASPVISNAPSIKTSTPAPAKLPIAATPKATMSPAVKASVKPSAKPEAIKWVSELAGPEFQVKPVDPAQKISWSPVTSGEQVTTRPKNGWTLPPFQIRTNKGNVLSLSFILSSSDDGKGFRIWHKGKKMWTNLTLNCTKSKTSKGKTTCITKLNENPAVIAKVKYNR